MSLGSRKYIACHAILRFLSDGLDFRYHHSLLANSYSSTGSSQRCSRASLCPTHTVLLPSTGTRLPDFQGSFRTFVSEHLQHPSNTSSYISSCLVYTVLPAAEVSRQTNFCTAQQCHHNLSLVSRAIFALCRPLFFLANNSHLSRGDRALDRRANGRHRGG